MNYLITSTQMTCKNVVNLQPTPLVSFTLVFSCLALAEHFKRGVSCHFIFLCQFRVNSGINFSQGDGWVIFLQFFGCFLIFWGKSFTVTTPVQVKNFKMTFKLFKATADFVAHTLTACHKQWPLQREFRSETRATVSEKYIGCLFQLPLSSWHLTPVSIA